MVGRPSEVIEPLISTGPWARRLSFRKPSKGTLYDMCNSGLPLKLAIIKLD